MVILGIDPGLSGAVAILDDGQLVEIVDIEATESRINCAHLASLIHKHQPEFAICELVSSRPGQGVTSTFTFGHALGSITGVLAALGVPYLLIRPQSWQGHFGIQSSSKDKGIHKQEIADIAQSLYPAASLYGPRGGLRDGRSDALLLAHYGHLHLSGSTPEALVESHKPKPKKATVRMKKPRKFTASDSNTVVL